MQNYFYSNRLESDQGNYDVSFYRLDIRIDPEAKQLSGKVTITASALISDLNTITVDFNDNMSVLGITCETTPLTYNHFNDVIVIYLDRSYDAGDQIEITIAYEGQPVTEGSFASFIFSSHNNNPIVSTLSEPFGARTWWPCKDNPADKADSVDIIVTVPHDLVVASNGLLIDVTDNADATRTFFWQERYPIATYLVSLASTNYAIYSDFYRYSETDSMEVIYYVYPEDLEKARIDFSVTVTMIEYFSSVFGEYPFIKEKYGIAEFPWSGAMEHQTCTSYGAHLISGDNRYDYINAHELAHQWFGDLITMANWSDIWLNEGFATYAEALWSEHVNGRQAMLDYMRFIDSGFFPTSVFVRDSTNVNALFSYTVYDKGAWVLHMLRYIMGDERFIAAIKKYAASYAYGNVTTQRFKAICEGEYGADLDWFFAQWVYGLYRPYYEYEWSDSFVDGHYILDLKIHQVQSLANLFKMPLDIHIKTLLGDTTIVVWDSLSTQSYQFKLSGEPYNVSIDPEGWVLKSVRIRETLEPLVLYKSYPNPFREYTTIEYELPYNGVIKLTIYNILGQHVRTLVNGKQFAQRYSIAWNGNDSNSTPVSAGLYFYQLTFDDKFAKGGKLVKIY